MKGLLILLAVLAMVWLLRSARRVPPPARPDQAPDRDVPTLRRCAHCGMHLVTGEGTVEARDGAAYCSAAHRLAGPRAPFGPR